MTEIEQKALALVNEVERDFGDNSPTIRIIREDLMDEALCRAIEHHEAYKQDVSDAVEHCRACSDPEAWTRIKFELERFILPKPDPLVAAMAECGVDPFESWADQLREALAKRGLKIVEIER